MTQLRSSLQTTTYTNTFESIKAADKNVIKYHPVIAETHCANAFKVILRDAAELRSSER